MPSTPEDIRTQILDPVRQYHQAKYAPKTFDPETVLEQIDKVFGLLGGLMNSLRKRTFYEYPNKETVLQSGFDSYIAVYSFTKCLCLPGPWHWQLYFSSPYSNFHRRTIHHKMHWQKIKNSIVNLFSKKQKK